MKKLFLAFLLLFALSACSKPCSEVAAEYLSQTESLLERWDDADEVASSTARMSLAGPVSELQAIRRDANDLEPPECAAGIHEALIAYMDASIDSFLIFMANNEDEDASRAILKAQMLRLEYEHLARTIDEPVEEPTEEAEDAE